MRCAGAVAQAFLGLEPEFEVAARRLACLLPEEVGGVLDFPLGGRAGPGRTLARMIEGIHGTPIVSAAGRGAVHTLASTAQSLPKECAALAKRCNAPARRRWQSAGVSPPLPGEPLAVHFPAIKAHWRERLRDEPFLSPLGRVDTLGCLMDATLLQLALGLETGERERWLRRSAPLIGSVHRHCACGLPAILKYYLTGEQALAAVLGAPETAGADEVVALFRAIGQHEVELLCGHCPHTGEARCGLRPAGAPG